MAHTGRRQSWGPRLPKPGLCERLSEGSSRRGRGQRPPKACEVAGQRIFSVESLRTGVAQSRVLGCSGLRPRTLEQTSIQARLWLWCSSKPAYLTGQTHLCTDIRASPVNGPVFWSASPSTVARCGPSSRASSLCPSGGSEVHCPSLSHSMGRSPRGKPSAVAEVRCQFWHVQDANPSLLTGETPLVGLIVLMRSENSHPLKITRGREMYEGELMKRASHGGREPWGLGARAGAGDVKRSRLRESGAAAPPARGSRASRGPRARLPQSLSSRGGRVLRRGHGKPACKGKTKLHVILQNKNKNNQNQQRPKHPGTARHSAAFV